MRDANRTDFRPSSHGGEEMRSYVEFRAAPAHDGRVFECFAHNPTFSNPRNLSARITLVVLCEYQSSEVTRLLVQGSAKRSFLTNVPTCCLDALGKKLCKDAPKYSLSCH